jgi:hypothetical protein
MRLVIAPVCLPALPPDVVRKFVVGIAENSRLAHFTLATATPGPVHLEIPAGQVHPRDWQEKACDAGNGPARLAGAFASLPFRTKARH